MDGYAQQISKDTLRAILEQLPDAQINRTARQMLIDALTADMIDPTPYTYSATYRAAAGGNGLAVGAVNSPVNINIQADADFLILNQTYDANSANAAATFNAKPIPNVTVLLTNTGSGYQMMDQAVPVPAMFGFGWQPFILPQPWLLQAKATLQVLATNFDPAVAYNLQLCFNGIKLKKYSQ